MQLPVQLRIEHCCALFPFFSSISVHGSGREFCSLVHTEFCVKKHTILARSVFVLRSHRLFRDIAVVLIASIAIWISDFLQCLI